MSSQRCRVMWRHRGETEQCGKNARVWNSDRANKRRWPVDDFVFIPQILLPAFYQLPSAWKKKRNQSRVNLLRLIGLSFCNLYLFIASLPLTEVFFVRRRRVSGQLSLAAASSVFFSLKAQQASVHHSRLVSKQSPSDFWGETEPSWPPRWHRRVFVLFS